MWPFGKEDEGILNLKKSMALLPSQVDSEVRKFRDNKNEMQRFCESYGIACALTHYHNLFLEYDHRVEKIILFFSSPIIKLLKTDKKKLVDTLKKYQSEEEYLVLVIIQICERYLGSGHYHIYRATLSPEGMAFALVHYALCRISKDKGYLSEKENKDILDYAKDCIKQVGWNN